MTAPVITGYASRFSETWPGVARLLRARLRNLGVAASDVEDLVQETAARALTREVPFDDEDHLLAWSTVVSRRLAIAAHRQTLRMSVCDGAPDAGVAPVDLEREVIARDAAERVLRALPSLSAADRRALAVTATPADRQEAVRLNVRRHRARARLRAAAGAVWGIFVLLRRALTPESASLAATAVALTAITSLALLVQPHAGPEPRTHLGEMPTPSTPAPAATPPLSTSPSPHPTAGVSPAKASLSSSRPTTAARPPTDEHEPTLPVAGLEVPVPAGDAEPARAGTRGGAPTELSLCVTADVHGRRCVALPMPASPLDDVQVAGP